MFILVGNKSDKQAEYRHVYIDEKLPLNKDFDSQRSKK